METIGETYKRSRLRTNVIDYRPVTAPQNLMTSGSSTYNSRSVSPVSIGSPRVAKEQIYRTILEKNEFDMDKLVQSLPRFNDNSSKRNIKTNSRSPASTSRTPRNNPRIFRSLGPTKTGTLSVPSSSRREVKPKQNLPPPNSSRSELSSRQSRTSVTKIPEGAAAKSVSEFTKLATPRSSKRPSTSDGKENPPPLKKDVLLKHVFAVNGSIVAFKSCGYENFTNWFGDETMLSKEKKPPDFFHREIDVWGFTNQEITMKLYCGNKLQIEGNRPARGKVGAKKFKETIVLPNDLPVEALIVCRNRSGRLILEEIPR